MSQDKMLVLGKQLPIELTKDLHCHPLTDISFIDSGDIEQIQQKLRQVGDIVPKYILGNTKTPATFWLAARQLYPDARLLVELLAKKKTSTDQPTDNQASSLVLEKEAVIDTNQAQQSESLETDVHSQQNKDLIWNTFLKAAWGAEKPEHKSEIEENQRIAEKRGVDVIVAVEKAIQDGRYAYNLVEQQERELRQHRGNTEAVQQWREKELTNVHPRVRKHLDKILEKWIKRSNNKKKFTKSKPLKLKAPVELNEKGGHPNAIRNLKPCQQWTVMVDETGTTFETEEAVHLNNSRKELGRLVAVLFPQGCALPDPKTQHATDTNDQEVLKDFEALLQAANVGIFGFTLKDPSLASSRYWISSVRALIRWVCLQLPIKPDSPQTHVEFLIEARAPYKSGSQQVLGLQQTIEDELKGAFPERFKNLHLRLKVVDKGQEAKHAYVDVVANLWGSPNANKRNLLKQAKLLNHCLLQDQNKDFFERMLNTYSSKKVSSKDWWDFVTAKEDHGLLDDICQQVGHKAKEDRQVWQTYLKETKDRMSRKEYQTRQLAKALSWLEEYQPQGKGLSPHLQLELYAARLAAKNHQGEIDIKLAGKTLKLANQLKDEMAPECCTLALRIVMEATNAYDFESGQSYLKSYLDQPMAVIGRKNYGKVHSALGQLTAFQGKAEEAEKYFTEALEIFDALQDPEEAEKEKAQTRTYKVFNDLQNANVSFQENFSSIQALLGDMQDFTRAANSDLDEDTNTRFHHHLLMRFFAQYPVECKTQIQDYLSTQSQWQTEAEHPWPLIDAYRGTLLWLMQDEQAGIPLFERAIDACLQEQNGPTLHWMGHVISAWACALEMPISTNEETDTLKFPDQAPCEILETLKQVETGSKETRWFALYKKLDQALPFNFH